MEKKMKKFNKILMMSVAILLCMVLISTSVVSGIFAKFVITKTAATKVTLKAFGVTLNMTVPAESRLENTNLGGATVGTEVKDGESATISITGLKMAPGDDYTNAVNFSFSGVPSVPVQVKIIPKITFNTNTTGGTQANSIFSVPANKISGITSQTYYMPIGFTFSNAGTTYTNNVALAAWSSNTTNGNLQKAIADGIKNQIKGSTANTSPTVSCAENVVTIGTFDKTEIKFKIGSATAANQTSFNMGFYYPLNSTSDVDKYDKISTYMAAHPTTDHSMSISYTVEIVQVAAATT